MDWKKGTEWVVERVKQVKQVERVKGKEHAKQHTRSRPLSRGVGGAWRGGCTVRETT